jgi:putative transcription factor
MMDCEMCGKAATAKASVEGVQMHVCGSCARYGKDVRSIPAPKPVKKPSVFTREAPQPKEELIETVRPDVAKLLRQHREKLGLNQEQFAAKLQIRASTYNHYESGASVPDTATARKLEHTLKIPLVVHMRVAAGPQQTAEEQRGLQLGDFIKKR